MATSVMGPTLDQLTSDTSGDVSLAEAPLAQNLDTSSLLDATQPLDLTGLQSTTDQGFLITNQPVDPTNTGDTGVVQNTSTPAAPGVNNPETAGGSSLGGILSSALNTGFAAWQLASQPAGTPKTVTTRVGATTITSGAPAGGLLGGLFGPSATSNPQTSQLFTLAIIALVVILIIRAMK